MRCKICVVLAALFLSPLVLGFADSKASFLQGKARLKAPAPSQNLFMQSLNEMMGTPPGPEVEIQEQRARKIFLVGGKTGREGIEVRIGGALAAVTDAEGAFALPSGVPEDAVLEFAIAGTVFHQASVPIEDGPLAPAKKLWNGTLYGVALDQDGIVPGALVIVTNGTDYAFDISNSLGIYAIHGAPTGRVLVLAAAALHRPALKAIRLQPGSPQSLNMYLEKKEGMGQLYGRAVVPGVGVLQGVYVNYTQPGGLVREDLTNLYGMYELLDIPAGPGCLYGHKNGFHDSSMNRTVEPGFNEQNIPMIPIGLGRVSGTVKSPAGDPVQSALVRLTFLNLEGDHEWKFAYAGAAGEFVFGDVPPGSYVVQSFVPGWHPGAAVGTVFDGSEETEELVMWPSDASGILEGWAVDFQGNPVPFAFGYISYIGFDGLVSGWALSDGNGHFLIPGVPFGPYAVHVESAAFLPDWAFSDILPSEEDDFLKILYPFDPGLAGGLGGVVIDAQGNPVPYAMVGCFALAMESLSFKTISDAQGNYCFPLLPPTVYGAFAVKEGAGEASDFDEVFTGDFTNLDLILQ